MCISGAAKLRWIWQWLHHRTVLHNSRKVSHNALLKNDSHKKCNLSAMFSNNVGILI
jgi:hypothetical protein